MQNNFKQNQKGVSLIITFFVMTIILAVVFAISGLLYSEVKIIKNMGNSVMSFYAAESGVEKVLYYDRQVLPTLPDTTTQSQLRGLCSMCAYDGNNNSHACADDDCISCKTQSFQGMDGTKKLYNDPITSFGDLISLTGGCNPATCNNCQITFSSSLDADNAKTYSVVATVSPSGDGKFSDLEIQSAGLFAGVSRKIDILAQKKLFLDNFDFVPNTCVDGKNYKAGDTVNIKVNIDFTIPNDTINTVDGVLADIYTGPDGTGTKIATITLGCDNPTDPKDPTNLNCMHGGNFTGTWTIPSNKPNGYYYVDVSARDNSQLNTIFVDNIQPCIMGSGPSNLPSFEIYSSKPYVTITSPAVAYSYSDNTVTVSANAYDVAMGTAGIFSVVASIKDSSGTKVGGGALSPAPYTGYPNWFSKSFNTKQYSSGNYTVDIETNDYLVNNSMSEDSKYTNVGSFIVPSIICADSNNAHLCITASTTANTNQINPFQLSLNGTSGWSNTLTTTLGSTVYIKAGLGYGNKNQTITFFDSTDSVNIGTAITDSSGIATIQYATTILTTPGAHTLIASYAGGLVPPSQATATLTVTSPGNCKSVNNGIICVTTTISPSHP